MGKMADCKEPIPMVQQIEGFLEKIPILQQLEDKSGVDKKALAGGVGMVLLLVILFGFGAAVLSMLVGFVYPAFSSFKALEDTDAHRQRFWLVYWVVYSCFCVAECFLEPILYFVPFYTPLKLGFLVYLFYPSTMGANTIYEGFLRDMIKPYVKAIDNAADKVAQHAATAAATAESMIGQGVGVV